MANTVLQDQEDLMSKLLINESPLQVQPSLAMAIGLNEAIFLQQLHYWLGASKFKRDDRVWVYNTYPEWLLQLKYMSLATLKRTIKSLKEQKLILVERFDKAKSNQVNFYAIDYDILAIVEENITQALESIDKLKMSQSISSNCTIPSAQNEPMDRVKMSQSLQENTQEITQENIYKKTKQKSSKFSLEDACSVTLPNGVDRSLWIAYIEMRHGMKKAPTQKAVELAIGDLTKMGSSVLANQALENSIKNSWVGLFKPKEAVQSYSNARNDRDAAWAEYYRNREQQHESNLVDIQGVTHV
ncbi:hypothetical protein N3K59_18345 [Acinetobacter baumannii]|uniref:hypothetical protein n=1 Tax=Acinetobacter baumannii TaxID=470 RepID=UPI001EC0C0B1|nr:hypothetical protein [Acinetobacter baumannii]EKX0522282.1 hypothetical protein [Acinetobacter baumannii]EKX0525811.1 hypothetical protein [Acinetobacter baumannii]EKX0535538.1 hypothetical protein [Acinetobacter baumannii]EKX0539430.1 hypothetical protein [Acinetobacter baumannii]EKY1463163.1 hypothetical protein [Acinetobacter baumannii]